MVDPEDIDRARAATAAGLSPNGELGTVTSLVPLTVNSTGQDEKVTAMAGYTPALGDVAIIMRFTGMTVLIGKVATGGSIPAAPKVLVAGQTLFPALYTFTWRDSSDFAYRTDVRQGAMDTGGAWSGAWFHQGGPRAALAGATVTGCAIKLTRLPGGNVGAQAAHLSQSSTGVWPIASMNLPPTTVGAAVDCVLTSGESQWFTLPTTIGQALVDGDAGLMIAGTDPMVILAGIDTDPESGLLRIDWTR